MKEKRYISEIRSVEGENSRHIVGYALLFNVRSVQLGDFTEVIMPEALNDEILKRSDVLALLNHDISRGVLARSRNGEGSLTLTIDEKGLKYEFDAPNTALGDELLEGIKRGDISNSSFSFLVKNDEWQQTEEGGYLRIIHEFDQLFDISPVYQPAYSETSVDCRGLDALKKEIESRMNEDNKDKEEKEEEKPAEEPQQTEEKPAEEEAPKSEDEEEKKSCQSGDEDSEKREDDDPEDNEDKESEPAEQTPAEDDVKEDEPKDKEEENRNNIAMKKKNFSLIGAINSIANGQPLDEAAARINAEGRSAMIESGLTPNGQLVLGVESRGDGDPVSPPAKANGIFATVETQGKEAVPTDTLDILAPLRARLVAAQSGATFMGNLVGNISLPRYSGSTANWKGEVAKADNGEGEFDELVLTPHRLCSVVEVSFQFLAQTSPSANAMLQADIVNSIADKLEATMFSADAGTANKPQGLFYGVTADTAAIKFDDILAMEQELEEANVYGNLSYVASPAAKATLRGTVIGGTGSGRFLMENNEIQGLSVLSTSNVVKNGLILGQWSDCIVAQWAGIDLVVDTVTKADEGIVRLIINSFWDFKVRRDKSFVKRILK